MFITAVKQRLKLNLVAVEHVMVFGATRTQIEIVASLPARTGSLIFRHDYIFLTEYFF